MIAAPSPVALEPARAAALHQSMRTLVSEYIDSSPETREIDAYQAGYKMATESPTSKVLYRKAAESAYRDFMVISDSSTTLDEYVELVYCESEAIFRMQQALFYGENLLDARILNVTAERTEDDPFAHFGIRYKKMSMPLNGVFEPRDTAYLECTGSFVNKKGLRGVYVVRESMDFEEVPPFPGVTRFYIKAIMLYTEWPNGKVESVQLLQANPLGKMPALVFNKTAMNYSHISDDNAKYLQQKRLLMWIHSHKPKHPSGKTKVCSSCAGAFRGLRARHECWGCFESMCGKCVVSIHRVLTLPDGGMKATPEEFCKRCYVQARSHRTSSSGLSLRRLHGPSEDDMSPRGSHHSTHSSRSNCSHETRSSSGNESGHETNFAVIDSAAMEAQLSQMQLAIETQRYLVAQMRERLEAQVI
ncbi:hypothetical protein ACHHYP_00677 [Achlya hypogyna]|uniref:FYVE zinc finger domain-containing protein n=1 Tax=Achlya hypogyna TaxID=1202772 RepID=A0A1V9ZUA6_ACHHY|nr:hypothetical protein ACHHYP_00677 [Achlya hypogyna]